MAITSAASAAGLLAAWEAGLAEAPLGRALLLHRTARPDVGAQRLPQLPVGEREADLFALRRALFGERMQVRLACRACGEDMEFELDAGELARSLGGREGSSGGLGGPPVGREGSVDGLAGSSGGRGGSVGRLGGSPDGREGSANGPDCASAGRDGLADGLGGSAGGREVSAGVPARPSGGRDRSAYGPDGSPAGRDEAAAAGYGEAAAAGYGEAAAAGYGEAAAAGWNEAAVAGHGEVAGAGRDQEAVAGHGEVAGAGVGGSVVRVREGGWDVEFRLPGVADLTAVARAADPRGALLARCLVSAVHDGVAKAATDLPVPVQRRIAEAVEAADPGADLVIDVACPECGRATPAELDIASYLWTELDAWARDTLLDVHLLATAYGWSEPDILALSPLRRRYYLELCADV